MQAEARTLTVERYWTREIHDPMDVVEWTTSTVSLKDFKSGKTVYHHDAVEHPTSWSQNAVDTVASKYFRRADIPGIGGESSVRQLATRVANCLAKHGVARGYFDEETGRIFAAEIAAGFITQRIGFNSPVWFNFGLFSEYGIEGSPGRKRWRANPDRDGEIETIHGELRHPGGAACFLSAVDDSLFNEEKWGMFDHLSNECRIFLTGAGDGFNASNIRADGEPIEGGGISAGLISYLKPRDAAAGYIKSGGKTRRSATLICLDLDHPDVEQFILWKGEEERKVHALIAAGWPSDYDGEAYQTVSGQNSNNSVRPSDAFMLAEENDELWYQYSRTPYGKFRNVPPANTLVNAGECVQGTLYAEREGAEPIAIMPNGKNAGSLRKIMRAARARELWHLICKTAHECGCPGIQYDDTINRWNTVPQYGRINTSNPCSEVCLPDWSVCNLGSVNLTKFFEDLKHPDWEGYEHACKLLTIALDLVVDISSYPTEKHAKGSYMLRSIGLNHGGIGAVLMRNGIPYDSDEGRAWMGAVTTSMTLYGWEMSHEMARNLGAYPAYQENDHQTVMAMHLAEAEKINEDYLNSEVMADLKARWMTMVAAQGFRNNTTTCLVPQGTIGLVLDQDTTGCEPDFALVKHKKCVGGYWMKIINASIEPSLQRLGYSDTQVAEIVEYVMEWGTLEGAPHIAPQHVPVFDTAVRPKTTLEGARINIPEHAELFARCKGPVDAVLYDLPEDTQTEIRSVLDVIRWAKTREDALASIRALAADSDDEQSLIARYGDAVKVFSRVISVEGHIDSLAAMQGHLSMSISKTCNLDGDATIEDVSNAYKRGWKKGVKCIAIYRDESKKSQPLSSGGSNARKTAVKNAAASAATATTAAASAAPAPAIAATLSPAEKARLDREGREPWLTHWPAIYRPTPHYTHECDSFKVVISDMSGPVKLFIRIDRYPGSNLPMQVFIDVGKQGDTISGLVDSIARLISRSIQHGVPIEQLGDVLEGMIFGPRGMLGKTSIFGIRYVMSIPDLLGKLFKALPAWWAAGRPENVLYPSPYDQSWQPTASAGSTGSAGSVGGAVPTAKASSPAGPAATGAAGVPSIAAIAATSVVPNVSNASANLTDSATVPTTGSTASAGSALASPAAQVGVAVQTSIEKAQEQHVENVAQAKAMGYTGLHCKRCGSLRTVGSNSCYSCLDCGEYNGPCGG